MVLGPTGEKLRLSPSKMIVFEQCPKHFDAVMGKTVPDGDSIYTCIGTAAHAVVEAINKGQVLTPDEREQMMRETLIQQCIEKEVGLDFPAGYKKSRDYIRTYQPPAGWTLKYAEGKRVLVTERYDFSYVADAVWENVADPHLWLIEDYKTSAGVPKTRLQLYLYAWALWKEGVLPATDKIRSRFHMLRDGKLVEVDVDLDIITKTDRYVEGSVDLMAALWTQGADFPRQPGNCHWCKVQDCMLRSND